MIGMIGKTAIALTLGAGLAAPAQAGIHERIERQEQRIQQGLRSGELTRREARRLLAEHAAIRAEARAFRRDGLQPWERDKLDRDLDLASRHIYEQKHDVQRR